MKKETLRKSYGTPISMQNNNISLAIRNLHALLKCNFSPDALIVNLHYEKGTNPHNEIVAKYQLKRFLNKLKDLYRKKGLNFKYIKTTVLGVRSGIYHIVVIPSGVGIREITHLWQETILASKKARPPKYRKLIEIGYKDLAVYFCCHTNKTVKNARKWNCSRNIKHLTNLKI